MVAVTAAEVPASLALVDDELLVEDAGVTDEVRPDDIILRNAPAAGPLLFSLLFPSSPIFPLLPEPNIQTLGVLSKLRVLK